MENDRGTDRGVLKRTAAAESVGRRRPLGPEVAALKDQLKTSVTPPAILAEPLACFHLWVANYQLSRKPGSSLLVIMRLGSRPRLCEETYTFAPGGKSLQKKE